MLVSVITITHNRAHLIGETIASVLAQSHGAFEYVILDDASDDGTEEVVRSFSDQRIRYKRVERIGRPSALRQQAVQETHGEWLAFIDSDDLWTPRKLAVQLALAGETDADLCGAGVTLFSDQGETSPYRNVLAEDALDLFDLTVRRRIVLIYPSALLFRRSAFDRVGGFDLALKCGEDDLFLRILASGPSTIAREPLVRIRRHESNISDQDFGGVNAYEEHLVTMHRLAARGKIGASLFRQCRAFDHYMAGSLLLRAGRTADARKHLWAAAFSRWPQGLKAALKYVQASLLERFPRR